MENSRNVFKYQGLTFIPKRKLTEQEREVGVRLPFQSIGMNNYETKIRDYSWDEFYAAAKAANNGKCVLDVFDYNGYEVVPCQNELFHLDYGKNSNWKVPFEDRHRGLHLVKVLFGDEEVNKYHDGEEVDFDNLEDACIKEYHFDNEDQVKGFMEGLNAMHGQLEYAVL